MADTKLRKGATQPGQAVDDEDPDASPMDEFIQPAGPPQPYDVERLEDDRRKSQGPRTAELPTTQERT